MKLFIQEGTKMLKWIFVISMAISVNVYAGPKLSQEALIQDPAHIHLWKLSTNPEIVIDHVNSQGYEVFGPKGLHDYLRSVTVPFIVPRNNPITMNEYPSPEKSELIVRRLALKYPELITLTQIGKSVEGRSLLVARITAPKSKENPLAQRPEFKYIANMHGDEIVGRELMVQLIADLASGYKKNKRITKLLNHTRIYIIPSMNPDGAAHHTRYNSNGADLNRSFPDFTTSDNQNTTDGREPEVQAIMKFQAKHQFKLSANFHGGAEVVNYPWDAQPEPFPLTDLCKELSIDYAKRTVYIYQSEEFENGITNGYAWYPVMGGMQDWSYHWFNDMQFTIELTNTKWPAYKTIAKTYKANRHAMLALIESIHSL